jgi:hypothetical protein
MARRDGVFSFLSHDAEAPVRVVVRPGLAWLEHVRRFPILRGIPESAEQ